MPRAALPSVSPGTGNKDDNKETSLSLPRNDLSLSLV